MLSAFRCWIKPIEFQLIDKKLFLFNRFFMKTLSSSSSSLLPPPLPPSIVSDQELVDYEEPIWEPAMFEVIDSIESQHFNKLKQQQKITTPIISSIHPSHLSIQLEHQSHHHPSQQKPSPSLSPTSCHSLYDLLHQRFHSLIPNYHNQTSLYSRFRLNRKFLSVTDLVSCIWCQFQVEYGLLGKRYLKPSQRPKSFISSSGIEIKVDSNMIISRQKILDGGKRVHSKLEKEVAPEKVPIEVITQVDIWGLKVMNTILNLSLLRSNGMMREINVWGFIGGFLVQGIIDQIDLIPNSLSTNKLNTPPQSPINDNLSNQSSPAQDSSDRLLARISDSKTTQSATLPPPEYTESARYQLMLYKYLHDQNASGRFDVERFGQHLGINLDESFSSTFQKDVDPLLSTLGESLNDSSQEEKFSNPKTLRSMFKLYDRMIKMIGVSDSMLEIVYRKRGGRRKKENDGVDTKKLKLKHDPTNDHTHSLDTTSPATPLPSNALAHVNSSINPIEIASNIDVINPMTQLGRLKEPNLDKQENEKLISESNKSIDQSGELIISSLHDNLSENGTLKAEKIEHTHQDDDEKKINLSPCTSLIGEEGFNQVVKDFTKFSSVEKMKAKFDRNDNGKIIGYFEFEFHPIEFYKFIFSSIKFWNGDQDPVGVGITEFNKCDTCEFKEGCEWRSKISNQIIESV